MRNQPLENPVLGYVVIAAALVVGMLSATVFGQSAIRRGEAPRVHATVASPEPAGDGEAIGQPRRWILGVRSRPSATGCLVTSVVPGSAASRAGIRPGDRILAVAGKQVGWLGADHRPLRHAVDASESRIVNLLLHRLRSDRNGNGQLVSLNVRLMTLAESLGH